MGGLGGGMPIADAGLVSTFGCKPHLPSDSRGSKTMTLPSVSPIANWWGSWGCAAITSGYTVELWKMNIDGSFNCDIKTPSFFKHTLPIEHNNQVPDNIWLKIGARVNLTLNFEVGCIIYAQNSIQEATIY